MKRHGERWIIDQDKSSTISAATPSSSSQLLVQPRVRPRLTSVRQAKTFSSLRHDNTAEKNSHCEHVDLLRALIQQLAHEARQFQSLCLVHKEKSRIAQHGFDWPQPKKGSLQK